MSTDRVTMEPIREHWTPYEPWMRDVLADDARVSWLDGNELRCEWLYLGDSPDDGGMTDGDLARSVARVHPDDVPERPTEDDPDEWKARYEALREDVEGVVAYFEEHPTAGVHPRHVARRIKWNVLDRDDERGGEQG